MVTINGVEDPAAVIAVPTQKDLDCIEGILQQSYDGISHDYEGMTNEEIPPWLMRRGSLCQELLAQLHEEIE